jgi:hypothetical protein
MSYQFPTLYIVKLTKERRGGYQSQHNQGAKSLLAVSYLLTLNLSLQRLQEQAVVSRT